MNSLDSISETSYLIDKSDFVSYLSSNIKVIVDLNCGDGLLLKYLKTCFPQYTYVGIESNSVLSEQAKSRCGDSVSIYSTISEFYDNCDVDTVNIHINLNNCLVDIFTNNEFPRKYLSKLISVYEFGSFSIYDNCLYISPLPLIDNLRNNTASEFQKIVRNYTKCQYNAYFNKINLRIVNSILSNEKIRNRYLQLIEHCKYDCYQNNIDFLFNFLLKYSLSDSDWEKNIQRNSWLHKHEFDNLISVLSNNYYTRIHRSYYTPQQYRIKWSNDFKFKKRDNLVFDAISTNVKTFFRKKTVDEMVASLYGDTFSINHSEICDYNQRIIPRLSTDCQQFYICEIEGYQNYSCDDENLTQGIAEEPIDSEENTSSANRDDWNYTNNTSVGRMRDTMIEMIRNNSEYSHMYQNLLLQYDSTASTSDYYTRLNGRIDNDTMASS